MKKVVTYLLAILITLLSINVCLKPMVIKTLNDSFTSTVVGDKMDKIMSGIDFELSKYNTVQISNDIRESKEMNIITNLYVKTLVNDLLNNNISIIDINNNMNNIVDEIFVNYNVDSNKVKYLKEIIREQDGTYIYNSLIHMIKNSVSNNPYVMFLLTIYNIVISPITSLILSIMIVGIVVISYLLNKNIYSLLGLVSSSLIIASVIMLIINIVFANYGMGILYGVLGKLVTMDFNKPILITLICFVVGISIKQLLKIISKKRNIEVDDL